MSYYNTTRLTGKELQDSTDKAVTQEDKVLIYFEHSKDLITPSEVWNAIFDTNLTPLTSVRRAITNLTKEEKLLKMDNTKKEGIYGKPEYYWTINKK